MQCYIPEPRRRAQRELVSSKNGLYSLMGRLAAPRSIDFEASKAFLCVYRLQHFDQHLYATELISNGFIQIVQVFQNG